MSAGRLNLAAVETGCYFTSDDLLTVTLTLVEAQLDVAERLAKLLNADYGRTLREMSKLLDTPLMSIVYAFAYLVQSGALFETFPVAGGEQGYKLVGWL